MTIISNIGVQVLLTGVIDAHIDGSLQLQLSGVWLGGAQMSRVMSNLHAICAQNVGTPVLFTLVNWLRDSLWDFLCLGNGFQLAFDGLEALTCWMAKVRN